MLDEPTIFVEQMERLFGSDEALGVYFQILEDDTVLTLAQFKSLEGLLGDDMPETTSLLPHGGSSVCCTDYAIHIYLSMPNRVQLFGFWYDGNPTSRFALEEKTAIGHDFAVVDGRYIVDPWPRLVGGAFKQMVFDLEGADAKEAIDIYGPRACWTRSIETEQYANSLQAPNAGEHAPQTTSTTG